MSPKTNRAVGSPFALGIASVLNEYLLKREMTGLELSVKSGIGQWQISRWINAQRDISVRDLYAISAALDVDPGEFMEEAQRRAMRHETGGMVTRTRSTATVDAPLTADSPRTTPE